jgi:hypothetical protein
LLEFPRRSARVHYSLPLPWSLAVLGILPHAVLCAALATVKRVTSRGRRIYGPGRLPIWDPARKWAGRNNGTLHPTRHSPLQHRIGLLLLHTSDHFWASTVKCRQARYKLPPQDARLQHLAGIPAATRLQHFGGRCSRVASGLHPPPYRAPPGCNTFTNAGRSRESLCASDSGLRLHKPGAPAANGPKSCRQTPPLLPSEPCKPMQTALLRAP